VRAARDGGGADRAREVSSLQAAPMPIVAFPDPRQATPEGIVAVGGDLHPDSLVLAYSSGIFPWPIDGMPLCWFCPPERAILQRAALHLGRSVRRERRRTTLSFTIDRAFADVMRGCAEVPRFSARSRRRESTWITPDMFAAYCELHRRGLAHSVEAWQGERLVGGVYGVSIGNTFSAESMFHLVPNASKLALIHLVEYLASRGLDWVDVQVMSPHVARLGARPEPRDDYLARLRATQAKQLALF
jgi:leucyl/phenylalanyl-tRNA--protein transferase